MPPPRTILLRIVGALAVAVLFASLPQAQGLTGGTESQSAIDLTKAKRGSCQKGELESGGGCVTLPQRTKHVFPNYPQRARENRRSGSVSLNVTLDRDGKIVDATVSGSLTKGVGLGEAALEAVRQWRFTSALLGGEPVPVVFRVKVDFKLS